MSLTNSHVITWVILPLGLSWFDNSSTKNQSATRYSPCFFPFKRAFHFFSLKGQNVSRDFESVNVILTVAVVHIHQRTFHPVPVYTSCTSQNAVVHWLILSSVLYRTLILSLHAFMLSSTPSISICRPSKKKQQNAKYKTFLKLFSVMVYARTSEL